MHRVHGKNFIFLHDVRGANPSNPNSMYTLLSFLLLTWPELQYSNLIYISPIFYLNLIVLYSIFFFYLLHIINPIHPHCLLRHCPHSLLTQILISHPPKLPSIILLPPSTTSFLLPPHPFLDTLSVMKL